MTLPLTARGWLTTAQALDLIELVHAATNARRDYELIASEFPGLDALPDWDRRAGAAHEAAMAAERTVVAAIRALRRTS